MEFVAGDERGADAERVLVRVHHDRQRLGIDAEHALQRGHRPGAVFVDDSGRLQQRVRGVPRQ